MNLNTLSQGEPWMTPEERGLNGAFIQSITTLLAARGVPETALLTIRVNGVIATWLLARRLESALKPIPGQPMACPSPAQAGAIGKCRDRLRSAIKELEACCPENAFPDGSDLLEWLQPVVSQPQGQTTNNGKRGATESTTSDPVPSAPRTPAESPHNPPAHPTPISLNTTTVDPPPAANRAERRRLEKENRRKKTGEPMRSNRPAPRGDRGPAQMPGNASP